MSVKRCLFHGPSLAVCLPLETRSGLASAALCVYESLWGRKHDAVNERYLVVVIFSPPNDKRARVSSQMTVSTTERLKRLPRDFGSNL